MSSAAPMMALSVAGSLIVGYGLARLYLFATVRVSDAASGTVLQFVSTFGVWMLAERVGLSAIVTMVVYAITLGRFAPGHMAARNRVSSYSVWETAVFGLNVLAFVLMGLQARPILEPALGRGADRGVCARRRSARHRHRRALCLGLAYGAIARLTSRWIDPCAPEEAGDMRGDLVIAWCGMRGLVTLGDRLRAAGRLPGRDQIVLAAFCVVLGTLVLQGMTLKPLLRLRPAGRRVGRARSVARPRRRPAGGARQPRRRRPRAAAAVREQYAAARAVAENPDEPQAATEYDELRLGAIKSQRQALERLREEGTIGDEAYHRIEEEIDWAELDAAPAGRFQPLDRP